MSLVADYESVCHEKVQSLPHGLSALNVEEKVLHPFLDFMERNKTFFQSVTELYLFLDTFKHFSLEPSSLEGVYMRFHFERNAVFSIRCLVSLLYLFR